MGVRASSPGRRRARVNGLHRRRVRQRHGRELLLYLRVSCSTSHRWATRRQLALAVFEWIEALYNPPRRHSSIGDLSAIDYEAASLRPLLRHAQHNHPVR